MTYPRTRVRLEIQREASEDSMIEDVLIVEGAITDGPRAAEAIQELVSHAATQAFETVHGGDPIEEHDR